MTKSQLAILCGSIFLFLGIYFGFDTKTPEQKKVEKARTLTAESTDINTLLGSARNEISSEESGEILLLEAEVNETSNQEDKVEAMKKLAGAWYKAKFPSISGFYAEQIAEIEGTAEAWSIAGSTYSAGIKSEKKDIARAFCQERALKAFENAVSLQPENATHRLNLALTHVEGPSPMKGIMDIRALNEKNPENVPVIIALGRLSLRSGQNDKAVSRLESALNLEPENKNAICLIAKAYKSVGNSAKADTFNKKCQSLSEN